MTSGTLTPAYGRDYKSKAEVLAAWNEGKDFILNTPQGSGPTNRPDVEKLGLLYFQVRWKKNTMVAIIKAGKPITNDKKEVVGYENWK
jgi:hypothetical protein